MNFFSVFLVLLFVPVIKYREKGKKIPLHDREGNIKAYAIVSTRDYNHLSKFSWYLTADGYVAGSVNRHPWSLHRYITIVLKGHQIDSKIRVDHINNNPLDNRRSNLRPLTSEEDRNRKKKGGCSSKYLCVTKKKNLWGVNLMTKDGPLYASYKKEEHAAHQYNLWLDQYGLTTAKRNKVPVPDDFVPWKNKNEGRDLPTNIHMHRDKYQVNICRKCYGSYNTLEEAIRKKEEALEEIEKEKEEGIMNMPMLVNEDEIPVIEIDKNGKKVLVKVDEDKYYDVMHYNWHLDRGYVVGIVNGKPIRLSRYVMNYYGEGRIDHIDGDKLDNRISKLRIATANQNAKNKGLAKNNISGYTGVSKLKSENYSAVIGVNGVTIYIGTFSTKDEAIKAREEAEEKYFGEFRRK